MKRIFKYFLLLISLYMSNKVTAQHCTGIRRAFAFYSIQMPGNIPKGLNGMPLPARADTANIIYVETDSSINISWETAWINGVSYNITAQEMTAIPLKIMMMNGKLFLITPSKKNKLWQLSLDPTDDNKPTQKIVQPNEILLKGKNGKKIIYQTIKESVQIKTAPNV